MESSEQKRGFGTMVLVLLLALAFVVGTGLFAYIGFQFMSGGQGGQTAQSNPPTATVRPSPTATAKPTVVAPTSTPVPTVEPPATALPTRQETATRAPGVRPSPTAQFRPGGEESLPQTGLGPLASIAGILLAGTALGSRWLRRRT